MHFYFIDFIWPYAKFHLLFLVTMARPSYDYQVALIIKSHVSFAGHVSFAKF